MSGYTNYEDILFNWNWTGAGGSNTTQIEYEGKSPDAYGVYEFKFYFAESQSDLTDTGYYNTPTNNVDGSGDLTHYNTVQSVHANQKTVLNRIFGQSGAQGFDNFFGEVAKIQFSVGTASDVDILVGQRDYGSGTHTGGGTAIAFGDTDPPSYPAWKDAQYADIWLNSRYDVDNDSALQWEDITVGGYSFNAILHEIGHALGLSHPKSSAIDSTQYTIMSTVHLNGMDPSSSPGDTVWASSLQIYDILAIQQIYGGRNYQTRAEGALKDTVYSAANAFASSQINGAFQYTIWDGGGDDTLDASGFSDRVKIDLRQGAFSSIGTDGKNGALFEWSAG